MDLIRRISSRQSFCVIGARVLRGARQFSTPATSTQRAGRAASYTNEVDPTNQTNEYEGLFYRMPAEAHDRLFKVAGYSKPQYEMFELLHENAILVRKPALQIIDYLKRADYAKPVNRYVIHGKFGNGKTYTLNHVLHYALNNQFLIIHCTSVNSRWFNSRPDVAPSESRPGRLDLPMESAVWLQQFRSQNASLLPKLDLKTSQKYTWSLREATEAGEPLTNVIDHGISRMKHASDCVAVLLKELRMLTNEGKCRTLYACDLANNFYYRTKLRHADTREVDVDHITIARAFKKLFRNDWKNGAVVCTVDNRPYFNENAKEWRWKGQPDLPKYLLTEEGFLDFDPFIPIKVEKYSEREMEQCLDYYSEKMLLQRAESLTDAGRAEIKFLSCSSPAELHRLATGW